MPISSMDDYTAEHWEEVREIIREALSSECFSIDLVSDSDDIGVIQSRIVNNLYHDDIVICDVSGKNPNVMFELGMRLAFDKPTIIIKDNATNYSFDTSIIEHLSYPKDLHYPSISGFKTALLTKTKATLKAHSEGNHSTFLAHFGEYTAAKVDSKEVPQAEFILKSLQNLESQVTKLNLKNQIGRITSREPEPSPYRDLIKKIIRHYVSENNINPNEIAQHEHAIERYCRDHLQNKMGYSQTKVDSLMLLFEFELADFVILL